MQNKIIKSTLLAGVGALIVFGGGTVLAQNNTGETTTLQNREAQHAERAENRQTRLAENKLRVCQQREKHINNIMDRIAGRGERHIATITKISERVQAFYESKGRTISDYDALVAEVEAKKAAAEAAVAQIKADQASFKCDGTDPKGAVSVFKENLKKEIAAIKAYKTAVKNLIVGVKSAQSTTNTTNTTDSENEEDTEGSE